MSWFSDAVNSVSNAVNAAQDFAEGVADAAQTAANTVADTAQAAANSAADNVQSGVDSIAGMYDSILGTTLFGQSAAALNQQIDDVQTVNNAISDLAQESANNLFDSAQSLVRG